MEEQNERQSNAPQDLRPRVQPPYVQPPYVQPPYNPQQYGTPPFYQQPVRGEGSGLAIAGLVCGILGIVGSWIPFICYLTLVLSILGTVFGAKGRKSPAGKGMATAGLVCGIVGTAFSVLEAICVGAVICAAGEAGGIVDVAKSLALLL